ncbi:MAG: PAS domain S-box protein, partial [Pseudomonadota bacterium]
MRTYEKDSTFGQGHIAGGETMSGSMDSIDDKTAVKARIDEIEVRAALITQIYSQARVGMFGAVATALTLAALMWEVVPHLRIVVWLAVCLAAQIPRNALHQRFRLAAPHGEAALPWGKRFLLGSTIHALLFGCAAFVIFPEDSFIHQCVFACILVGFAAAIAVAHAPLTECYVSSVCLTLLPLIARFFHQGGETGLVLTAGGFAFGATVLGAGRAFNGMIKNVILLGFQKDALLSEVSQSRTNLRQAVADRTMELSARNLELLEEVEHRRQVEARLSHSEDRYRNLFTLSRDAIDMVTRDGAFIDFNRAFSDLTGYPAEELHSMTA